MKQSCLFASLCLVLCILSMNILSQKPGEIVCSKTLIDASNPVSLTTQFQSGDNVYAVAFLEKSIVDFIGSENKKVDVEVFLYELKPPLYSYQQPSEIQLESNTLQVSGDALRKKNLPLDIVPGTNAMTATAVGIWCIRNLAASSTAQ